MKKTKLFSVLGVGAIFYVFGLELQANESQLEPLIPRTPKQVFQNQINELAKGLTCFSVTPEDVTPEGRKYLSPSLLSSMGEASIPLDKIIRTEEKKTALKKCYNTFQVAALAIGKSAKESGDEKGYISSISSGVTAMIAPTARQGLQQVQGLQAAALSGSTAAMSQAHRGTTFDLSLNSSAPQVTSPPITSGGSSNGTGNSGSSGSSTTPSSSGSSSSGSTGISSTSNTSNTSQAWVEPPRTFSIPTDGKRVDVASNASIPTDAVLMNTDRRDIKDANGNVVSTDVTEVFKRFNSEAPKAVANEIKDVEKEKTKLERQRTYGDQDFQFNSQMQQQIASDQKQAAQTMTQAITMMVSQCKKKQDKMAAMAFMMMMQMQQQAATAEANKLQLVMQKKHTDDNRALDEKEDALDEKKSDLQEKQETAGNEYLVRTHNEAVASTGTGGTSGSSLGTGVGTVALAAVNTRQTLANNCQPGKSSGTGLAALVNDTNPLLDPRTGKEYTKVQLQGTPKVKGVGGVTVYRPFM